MIRALALLTALMLPMQALALSCVASSIKRSYHQFDAAEETFVIIYGQLAVDDSKMPRNDLATNRPDEKTIVPSRLTGHGLTKQGFTIPFDQDIALEVVCYGPWCGNIKNATELLAFVKRNARRYTLEINPCGGTEFRNPTPDMLAQVEHCFKGGPCEAD